jgi:hypothetical protein
MSVPQTDMNDVDWSLVESQGDLDALDASVTWDDAELVAFVGDTSTEHEWFPRDVARSGYLNFNIRVLLYVASKRGSHLELVLVDCDEFGRGILPAFGLRGRVDTLKRVEVHDSSGVRRMRCSRLMYRFVEMDQAVARSRYRLGEGEAVA